MRTKFGFIILLFCAVVFICTPAFAEQSLQQVNQQRQAAKDKIYKLKLLEKIETNKLYSNQQRLQKNQKNLHSTKQRLAETQNNLNSLEDKLEEAYKDYHVQMCATDRRIVQIYKTQRKSYIEFLLNAKNISNFLDRIYFVNLVMAEDRLRIAKMQKKTRHILILKEKITNQKLMLSKNEKNMKIQQKNLEREIDKNERLITKLKTDRATWERAERELAARSKNLSALINRSTTKAIPTATGSFIRPVYGGITSYYGWRTHPIFKKRIFHSGVDIGAPMRTPIKAANDGKVIFTGWYGGYGNVVIINHGSINGATTTTLYAHMSSIAVSKGQAVKKGQVVGRVGTTGYSTGPHLHFEVRRNGATVNPLNYIPG
ncbi:peptidoglycan DD-metalloendopeptidase family protein [bacterium]|nr:peptidoglycan DD-metalloendopeptidase family protein [bacterium]